jgi:hypothetical protein
VFVVGLLMIALGLVGAFFAIADPIEGSRWGGIGVAVGCGLGGLTLAYLDAPSRKERPKPGMVEAKATVLDASGTEGSVAGYQMVELTLEVRPKEGIPFQAKRKFSAGRLGRLEQGRTLDVFYDPADPRKIELA